MAVYLPVRKQLRLKRFDYSAKGAYFITICAYKNLSLFGHIHKGVMYPDDLGIMVESFWGKIPDRFPKTSLGEFILMPNHIHGIIILGSQRKIPGWHQIREASEGFPYNKPDPDNNLGGTKAAPSIPQIIHWFKTWTTNEYYRSQNRPNLGMEPSKLWHRSYYDHIIRNGEAYNKISEYIRNNPYKWGKDIFFWPENNLNQPCTGGP